MKKMHKVNVPSSVKKEEDLNSLKVNKLPVTGLQYGITLNQDGRVSVPSHFKHVINKISKNGSISVSSVSMGNQGPQRSKKSLIKLNNPSSNAIESKKYEYNKILSLDLKATPILSGSKSSSIPSVNSGALSKQTFSKPMARNTTQSTMSINNKMSLLKLNKTELQKVNTIIEPLESSECSNSFADELKNLSPIIKPVILENSGFKERIVKDATLQLPAQLNSNITISKASNIMHRKVEPPSVDFLSIQVKSTAQSSKSNMNVNQILNTGIGSKVPSSNDSFTNITSEFIATAKNENGHGDNENEKADNENGKANDKNEKESYILNPKTGLFETFQNGNTAQKLLDRSFFNNIIKNTIEQEFNGSASLQTITKKLEDNQSQKFSTSNSIINKAAQESILKKIEQSTPNSKVASSSQSSTNMKENIDYISPEIIEKESEGGLSVKSDFQHCAGQIPVSESNENLLCGSRTKVRAKSMGVREQIRSEKREILSFVARETCEKTVEKNQKCDQSTLKLLCNEKIQISPDILKPVESQKPIISLLTPTKSQNVLPHQRKLKSDVIDLESLESQSLNSSDDVQYVSDSETSNSKIRQRSHDSAMSFLKHIGMGTNDTDVIKKSRLNLNFNKFGLISLNEKHTVNREKIGSSNYEKPIYYRENKTHNTADYTTNLYNCQGCHCYGRPEHFLSLNFCSKDCIDKKKNKKIQNPTDAYKETQIVRAENRQRKTSSLLNSKLNNLMADQKSQSNNVPLLINKKPVFSWQTYLNLTKSEPAGINLFLNPFPCGPNLFEVGMKLEAIDPEHNSLFCVCTVVEKKGFRMKLHFDNYSSIYDFWINADSMDIFPPGWCNKNKRILTPPKGYLAEDFCWSTYLINTKALPAPRQNFTHLNSSSNSNPFKVGMKLEATDLRSTSKVCVASVVDVLDNRILVHFDGCDDKFNYWVDCGSPYIHPVNWHLCNNCEFVQPPNFGGTFVWKKYLEDTNGVRVTGEMIHARKPMEFKAGMKLEIVDKKNPSLIRPATVIMVDKYDLKILYDGWLPEYALRVVDDNPDIHPISWCESTGHELESPPKYEGLPKFMPCPMPGCRGIGNAKNVENDFHATLEECPYELSNWSKDIEKPDRPVKHYNRKLNYADHQINKKRKSNEPIEYGGKNLLKTNESTPILKTSTPKLNSNRPVPLIPLPLTESEIFSSPRFQVSKKLLIDYGPRLQSNLHYWSKNITKIFIADASQNQIKLLEKNPLQFSVDDVFNLIKNIPQCNKIAEIFRHNEINGEALLSLREIDLIDILNLKLGPSIKIYNIIVYLRGEVLERKKKIIN